MFVKCLSKNPDTPRTKIGGYSVAKRFTDTGKWDRAWFRKLPAKMKCAWIFLCDRCDHAGVWEIDEDAAEFFIGEPVSTGDMSQYFGEKIEIVGTKIVIKTFTDFQYGTLNSENRVHKSVIERLEKVAPSKGLTRPFQGRKDTDKDKEKEKRGCGGDFFSPDDLAELWNSKCDSLPNVSKLTTKRTSSAKSQLAKYPDPQHWAQVLERWVKSEFCLTRWRPTFDDWLNENKRIATLEGKYDNRESAPLRALPETDWETIATQVLNSLLKRGTGSRAIAEIEADLGPELFKVVIKAGTQRIRDVPRGPFQLKNIAEMLETAAGLMVGA